MFRPFRHHVGVLIVFEIAILLAIVQSMATTTSLMLLQVMMLLLLLLLMMLMMMSLALLLLLGKVMMSSGKPWMMVSTMMAVRIPMMMRWWSVPIGWKPWMVMGHERVLEVSPVWGHWRHRPWTTRWWYTHREWGLRSGWWLLPVVGQHWVVLLDLFHQPLTEACIIVVDSTVHIVVEVGRQHTAGS